MAEVKKTLERLIPSYKSNSKIVDHIYKEQLNLKNDFKTTWITKDQEN